MTVHASAPHAAAVARDWAPGMVEARLEEAADTLRRLPAVKVQGYFSTWPPIIRDFWEAFGRHDAEVRLGPATPAAIDRMDETLLWLRWLEPDEVRLVWLRAEGVRWKLICARFGIGRTTAWYRWSTALGKIAVRLNAGMTGSGTQVGGRDKTAAHGQKYRRIITP